MNLLLTREITVFERAQASADDTWLVVAIIIVCFVSLASAILERSKLLQRSVIENEVASRLRAKETLEKYPEGNRKDAVQEETEQLPRLDEAAAAAHLNRGEDASSSPEAEPVQGESITPPQREMLQVRTPDGRLIMIPARDPSVPEEVTDQDWIDLQIYNHDHQ